MVDIAVSRDVVEVVLDGFNGEWDGDHVAVGEAELTPQLVGARRREGDVELHGRAEPLPGQGEYWPPLVVADLGVLVGEGGAVSSHGDDVARGGEVGLQVVDGLARGCVVEVEPQIAGGSARAAPTRVTWTSSTVTVRPVGASRTGATAMPGMLRLCRVWTSTICPRRRNSIFIR